jgi:hypothetical protein
MMGLWYRRQQHQANLWPDHPDANLLSGFAEGALSKEEHRGVLSHVADCNSCRQCVSFVAQTAAPRTCIPRTSWRFLAPVLAPITCGLLMIWHGSVQTSPDRSITVEPP